MIKEMTQRDKKHRKVKKYEKKDEDKKRRDEFNSLTIKLYKKERQIKVDRGDTVKKSKE